MRWQKYKEQLLASRTTASKQPAARKLMATTLISALVMLLLNGIRIYDFIIDPHNPGLPLLATIALFLGFLGLWRLAKTGKIQTSAWLLIIIYSLPTLFCFYHWGADLPAAIMMTILIVMLAGIFLGSKAACGVAATFVGATLTLSILQSMTIIAVDNNWRQKPHQVADSFSYILIFGVIFLLAWIISRENRTALAEAAAARSELQTERDNLEITVIERTREIKQIQRDRLEQLQTLASIGQLSGGIFHDIVNPLTVVNLNLEQIKTEQLSNIDNSQDCLQQALAATGRIKDLINSANACLRRQDQNKYFSVREEIEQIKKIMDGKARAQNITICLEAGADIKIKGGPTRFGQIIMNLIANAIDACLQAPVVQKEIKIKIDCEPDSRIVNISIQDNGKGIAPENMEKIFNSFFTTKTEGGTNVGLGLSVVKEIVEQDFNGRISVSSRLGQGCTFTVSLPINL